MIRILRLVIVMLLVAVPVMAENINERPDVRPFNIEEAPHWRISSKYGVERNKRGQTYFHTGIDYSLWLDTKARAAGAGEVIFTRFEGDYGNLVIVKHEWIGYEWNARTGTYNKEQTKITVYTYYAHLVEITVRKGDKVKKGDEVGLVGSTGYSDGTHLHYEVRNSLKKCIPNWVYNSQRLSEEKVENARN